MATTYDKASLVMIPSGVKESKLYSIKPTSGDGDFTFSRGTDTATRVNSSGLIEKERSNQLLQSNQFDTTWGPSAAISVTGGQSGYDGTSDAWLLKRSDAAARYINQNITLGSSVYTYSIYAKAESENWIFLWSYDGTGSVNAYFDLSGSGAVGTTSGLIDANIESVGGGWFRCAMTYSNNISSVRIYPAVADGTTTGGITDAGVYIQDSQIEEGLVATAPAIETTTAAVYEGITDNLPRLDYSGGASCPSLLLEPSRTNYIKQSSYYGTWLDAGTTPTITTNYGISPEGVQNSSRLQLDTADLIYESGFSLSTGNYTFSVFGKAIGDTYDVDSRLGLRLDIPSAKTAFFDLVNGVVISQTADEAKIENYGNGWWRCSITQNNCVVNNAVIYGNGFDSEIYGAQLEAGSYPTSYIPTYGTSASRASDTCSKTSASALIGQTEGTLFVEFESGADDATNHIVSLSNGTTSNRVSLVKNTNDDLRAFVSSGGSTQASLLWPNYAPNTNIKAAISYKANEIIFYANGENAGTDTSALVPASLTQVEFETSSSPFAYPVKQFIVFPIALTAAELAALTTI